MEESTTTPTPPTSRLPKGENLIVLLLVLILLLGAFFRFTGLDWDGTNHLHPDERFLTIVAAKLEATSNPLTYLKTSESPLNPYNRDEGFYVYGNFPMTVTRYVAEWVTSLCERITCNHIYIAYDGIHLVGRALSALVDLVSILFTFLIGRRLYGSWAGLLGAFFLAAATLPIQQSHFFTTDNWAAALATLTMYTAVRASEKWEIKWYALFGLGLGLTVASRINVAPLAGMVAVAAAIWLARQAKEQGFAYLTTVAGNANVQRAIIGVGLAALVSVLTFRLAQPYAFADSTIIQQQVLTETGQEPSAIRVFLGSIIGLNPQWVGNMEQIQAQQSPDASAPPATQWTDRAPITFPWTNMVLWGMGLPAGILAWIGFFFALWRIIRARPDWIAHALPVAWAGGYFLFAGTRWVKSIRYLLPIYPFLLLLAGWAIVMLWGWARKNGHGQETGLSKRRQLLAGGLTLLVVIPTLLWANAFVDIYRKPVTRVAASAWMYENVPSGATLLYSVDGEPREFNLPLRGYRFDPGGIPLLVRFMLPEQGTVTGIRFNYLTNGSLALPVTTAEGVILENPVSPPTTGVLTVSLAAGTQSLTAEQTITATAERQPFTFDLEPTNLAANQEYFITAQLLSGGPIEARSSVITSESWDDGLPVRMDGRDPYSQYYEGIQMVTIDAAAQARGDYYQWLEQADYIALSSQRASWSLPRIPLTFPLATRYYEALFSGELGFELVNQFHADIHVGPLYISDVGGELGWGAPPEIGWPPPSELAAEEAFSVYDHPPVWIFAKTDAYSLERAQEVLGAVDLSNQMFMTPGQATEAPNGLMLSPEQQAVQEANGSFATTFNPDGFLSQNPGAAAVVWWLAIIVLGWVNFPLTWFLFRGLPSRGYLFSRIFVLLLIAYFGWILASLEILPNTRTTLLLGLTLILIANGAILLRWRQEIVSFLRQNLAFIGIAELAALTLYLILILIRLGNPDVWDVIWGGEKPMDLTYFTAVMKSTIFPPYDPWLSGGYINYYYWGFVYVGALTKLLAIVPAVAYNLILPMLFSFTGMAVFSLAYDLVARWEMRKDSEQLAVNSLQSPVSQSLKMKAVGAGLAAATICVLLGNLAQVGMILSTWHKASDSQINTGLPVVDTLVKTADGALDLLSPSKTAPIYPGDWFWLSSRAINYRDGEVQPITEFPFFTFLYGDLHAHMIDMPLTMLALAWAVSLVMAAHLEEREKFWQVWLLWLVGGIMVGALKATNTWDWPTFLVLAFLAIVYRVIRRNGRVDLSTLGQAGLQVAAFGLIFALAFRPYDENFGAGYTSLELWKGSYTFVFNYLSIYGLFLFLALSFLVLEFRRWSKTWTQDSLAQLEPMMWPLLAAAILFLFLIIVLLVRDYWIAPVVLPLVLIAGLMGIRPNIEIERRIVLILISASLFLTLFVEIFVLKGDVGRMNTVFKFYMQVWLMLSVVGGVSLAWVWPQVRARPVWKGVLALLLFAAALYPLTATPAKWSVRMSQTAPKTLDGMAFMPVTTYGDNGQTVQLNFDYEALQWMQRNIAGSPVVVEGRGASEYRSVTGRVAMYTGLPSVVGWDWHQRQQRAVLPGTIVSNRIGDVQTLYTTTDIPEALRLLEKYDVQYIYVGQLEYIYYDINGLLKFDQMVQDGLLQEVYRNGGTSIYQVLAQS